MLVVGSTNMDLVVACERFPRPGETMLADDFQMFPGGKGANQAVACAKLGGRVHFLGKMGRDPFSRAPVLGRGCVPQVAVALVEVVPRHARGAQEEAGHRGGLVLRGHVLHGHRAG